MVFLTHVLGYSSRRKSLYKGFIDTLRLHVKGGSGGAGIHKYGGRGGAGGNVCVTAREGMSLLKVQKKLKSKRLTAEPGSESSPKGLIGPPGENLNIDVPVGITILDDNGVTLGDLNEDGAQLIVAKGGLGGCEPTGYCGLKGEARTIVLDLKLIADVGLIGFPNAGKSTLLSVISKAKPKIANYPFTTMKPQIGVVRYPDFREITVADLPGLIEGAHANVGMGHKFLKHIERTKLLLFVADVQGFQLSVQHVHRSCLTNVLLLNREIELYKPDLLNMPAMIIVNKMDAPNADDLYRQIEPRLRNLEEFAAEFDEDLRPQRVLHFDSIIPAALALRKPDELDAIKEALRKLIDNHMEQTHFADGDPEKSLKERLEKQLQQHAPTLV